MTTTKQIRAALDAATPGPWELINTPERGQHIIGTHGVVISTNTGWKCYVDQNDVRVIVNALAWLAWCLDQIERRDKLLREYVDTCDECFEDEFDAETCPLCKRARKLMEGSK